MFNNEEIYMFDRVTVASTTDPTSEFFEKGDKAIETLSVTNLNWLDRLKMKFSSRFTNLDSKDTKKFFRDFIRREAAESSANDEPFQTTFSFQEDKEKNVVFLEVSLTTESVPGQTIFGAAAIKIGEGHFVVDTQGFFSKMRFRTETS